MNPKILLIDDDPLMLATYRDLLGDHGLDVAEAQRPEAALAALEQQGPWDVIVLDELLRGPGGSAMATELLGQIAARAPEARTIVITGLPTVPRVKAAVAAGAWDYLQKEAEYLDILLPLRVRHAVEAARERRLHGVSASDLERELRQTWSAALAPGLDQVSMNRRGSAEELDVLVTNNSTDPVLSKEGRFFLIECKNWSRPVDPRARVVFRDNVRHRFGACGWAC